MTSELQLLPFLSDRWLHLVTVWISLHNVLWKRLFPPDVQSPSFGVTCPSDIKRFADRGKNFTAVTWPAVIATDNSGVVATFTKSGVRSIFYRGKHLVLYNATDEAGNYKTCTFFVVVEGKTKELMSMFIEVCFSTFDSLVETVLTRSGSFFSAVLKCQTLLPPLNGFIDGKCDNSYGATCSMRCKDGYNLIGAAGECDMRSYIRPHHGILDQRRPSL